MQAQAHIPVMLEESIRLLSPQPGCTYADATLGLGGHTAAILEASAPDGHVVALDRDLHALEVARQRLQPFAGRVTMVEAEFANLRQVLNELGIARVQGLIADLGVSSLQLDTVERGFAFRHDAPLDMRMSPRQAQSAHDVLESVTEAELADILWRYGEENRSRAIARAITRAKKHGRLATTTDLASVVLSTIGRSVRSRVHPATRTFQALRIYVNQELKQLEQLLEQCPDILNEGGVVVILSFHSLEDRLVKRAFRNSEAWQVLTKKPLTASETEVYANPRARSAKLRAAQRTSFSMESTL